MATTPLYTIDNDVLKSSDPDRELRVPYKLTAGLYYGKGQVLVESGVAATLRPIVTASTGTPKAIMPLSGTTDAAGLFYPGTPASAAGQFEQGRNTVSVLTGGTFKVSDLTGLHANQFVPGGPQNDGWTLHGSTTSGWIEK